MLKKIKEYNAYYSKVSTTPTISEGSVSQDDAGGEKASRKSMDITYREVNSRLILEGVLKVYWGVDSSIRLKEFDDKRIIAAKKLEAAAAKSRREERDRKAMSLGQCF